MAEHLAPGGRLVLMGPRLSAAGRCYRGWHRHSNGINVHLLTARTLTEAMARAGLLELGCVYPFLHSLVMGWRRPMAG